MKGKRGCLEGKTHNSNVDYPTREHHGQLEFVLQDLKDLLHPLTPLWE